MNEIFDKEGSLHKPNENIGNTLINHFKDIYSTTIQCNEAIDNLDWRPITHANRPHQAFHRNGD